MGKVTIQEYTTKLPYELMGQEAGICYGANISNLGKNKARGINCLSSGHMRAAEYVQIYMVLEGYSARVMREFYTHIGGAPTRLQASTRYIDYSKQFDYIVPENLSEEAKECYNSIMKEIQNSMYKLINDYNVPVEDAANVLPLGMSTTVVVRTNLRNIIDMSHQRLCNRAYWEFRELMNDIIDALVLYSPEYLDIVDDYCVPKCIVLGHCPEKKPCGKLAEIKMEYCK